MSATPSITPEYVATLSFEEAQEALEQIVQQLESGKSSLESAISLYEQGNILRTHCEKKLQEATLKVEQIIQQENGELITEPSALADNA